MLSTSSAKSSLFTTYHPGQLCCNPTRLDLREAPDGVGIALHEANEQRRLRVWPGPLLSQSVEPFHQLIDQVALFPRALLLRLSSSLRRSFNASRRLGVKSDISSLPTA